MESIIYIPPSVPDGSGSCNNAEAFSLTHIGLKRSYFEDRLNSYLKSEHPPVEPSGITYNDYLNCAERIVRSAVEWQDNRGAIIDPHLNKEWGQTTSRYTSSAAILLSKGRIKDLESSAIEAMDWCCYRLETKEAQSVNFWPRELITAYQFLTHFVSAEKSAYWRNVISSIEPEQVYGHLKPRQGNDLGTLHNWAIYAAGGEAMRAVGDFAHPLPDTVWGEAFVEKYLGAQWGNFTEHGMYRDPGNPALYDVTTTLQLVNALAYGYKGECSQEMNEIVRRGGITRLFMLTSNGYLPYGGRSSQYCFNETVLTALFEWEARRYQKKNPQLAGIFKRQARRSMHSIKRWLMDESSIHEMKNQFPVDQRFGMDTYGTHSVYSLLAASNLGLASLYADETEALEEVATPSESHAHVTYFAGTFNRLLANCGDTHLQIETKASLDYDATGLGRFTQQGIPLELGLGMSFSANPKYLLPKESIAKDPVAIGPVWQQGDQWISLASLSDGLDSEMKIFQESLKGVIFSITYKHSKSSAKVIEHYELKSGSLKIHTQVWLKEIPVKMLHFRVPLLSTNGACESQIQSHAGLYNVDYKQSRLSILYDSARIQSAISKSRIANRNGLYHSLNLSAEESSIRIELRLSRIQASACSAI